MRQQFLPRSLRLRLGLVEAASGSRDAQPPAGCSAPQPSAMAVPDIHTEAASVADYLRKHNLTETLAVFLKEAKLAEQQNEVTNSAEAAANNSTAAAAPTTTVKSSKKRKPVGEGKGPDPVVLESVFNALAAGTVETKPSAAGAVENGEKLKKKKAAKEDDKKGKDAHPAEGGGDSLQKDDEQQDAAKSSGAVATVSKEAPPSVGAAEEALVQETPSKEQKKRKKNKASRGAPSEPEPEPAVEELLQVAAIKEQEQAADKLVDVAQTAEKSSKKASRKGKKSAIEDVPVATANVDKIDAGEGGVATANAESPAGADAETNGHVDVAALGTVGLIAGQPVASAKGKGKKGKKDKTVAPEPEPTQAGTSTTSEKEELVKDEHTEAAKGDGSDAGAAAKTDASVIGGQDVAGDVVMEPSEPNAALEAPGTQGKKRGGKGKKEKKSKVAGDAENVSAEQDVVVAADVGTVNPQQLGDVDMTPAEEAETEQQGIDTNGRQKKKKGGKKGKKGEVAAQEDKDAAAAAPGAVAGAHIDTNLADTTETIADQGGTSKATQAEGQQTGSALPSAKKKGKKGKDRSAAPDEPAAVDVTPMAVEPAAPNGAEVTDNKKRKRAETDADAGEQHTVAGNGSAGEEGTSVAAPQAKKAKKGDKKPNDTAAKTFFQRVDPSKVEIADPRLQDNSYWAKAGADSGWGAKAEEVLGKVRGKDFRHEKTKKKRGSYKGGAIDLQSHSVKFNYDDE